MLAQKYGHNDETMKDQMISGPQDHDAKPSEAIGH